MNIPFLDLQAQHQGIFAEVSEAMRNVVESADFILGAELERFEEEFARYCEAKYAVGLDSGISALELALRANGIGTGDEVITVSHTFIATASAISFTGAKPVFVDVDPTTYTMDVKQIEAAITRWTKAILPVHLYGQPADMDPILKVATRHDLLVIEDACQAHGARYKNRRVGALGTAGCFSFYPGKNLGAFGDGGMLVTNDAHLAGLVRVLRNYGQREKYHHIFLAYNRRLDSLQAAVLRVKLSHLDEWNERRQCAAQVYNELLAEVDAVRTPAVAPDGTHVYHLYVIQHSDRDRLRARLKEHGVITGLHYPIPVHLQPCYKDLGIPIGSFPVTESLAKTVLSLPMFPELTEQQAKYVSSTIREFETRAEV
jgi:dTDP-4-amino-4,6-dideoxygalactose transaminase